MQDVVCERRTCFIQERHDPVALSLGPPHKDFCGSPADILKFECPDFLVAQTSRGENEHERPVSHPRGRRHVDRLDRTLNILPCELRRQVRQAPARCPRNEPGKILIAKPGPLREAKKCPNMRRCCGSGRIVSRQRQEVLHDGEHVLTRHLGERLIREMVSKPYENPATGPQKPLARLRLQATHAEEMILVGCEQRAIGIR